MDTSVEERIRARAHEIWEQEGRPEGREVEHWLQAAEEVARAEGKHPGPAGAAPETGADRSGPGAEPVSPERTEP